MNIRIENTFESEIFYGHYVELSKSLTIVYSSEILNENETFYGHHVEYNSYSNHWTIIVYSSAFQMRIYFRVALKNYLQYYVMYNSCPNLNYHCILFYILKLHFKFFKVVDTTLSITIVKIIKLLLLYILLHFRWYIWISSYFLLIYEYLYREWNWKLLSCGYWD